MTQHSGSWAEHSRHQTAGAEMEDPKRVGLRRIPRCETGGCLGILLAS